MSKTSVFSFHAFGHPQVSATHPTTLEVTTDDYVTSRGDCIVAVRATRGLRELPARIRETLSGDRGRAELEIRVGAQSFQVMGRGSEALTFRHPREIVVRKSGFVSDRTLLVSADKAAKDIPRSMVRLLQNPHQKIYLEIRAIRAI